MPITDLFWACPVCGARDGLQHGREGEGKGARCHECGSRFRRVQGARIEVLRPDGRRETASVARWLDRLPPVSQLLGERPIRQARATLRIAEAERVIREGRRYLNRIEIFGKPDDGTLRLRPDAVIFRPDRQGSDDLTWPFEGLTAIQPSSHTLQLKARDRPVASLHFASDSVRLWEELLMHAVRDFYRRTGRGDVVEFQPRISVR
ncbi:MAG: hypothetical protein P8099_10765 [Gemmatimonadota bacterium]|jgi:hypothetical protein